MKKILAFLIVFIFLSHIENSISQIIYSNKNVEVTNIRDKIYLLKETIYFTGNIVAFSGPDGIVLFDTGFREAADDLVDAVKNIKSGKVEFIINSHAHGDHVGANSFFGEDVTIIGHKICEESFTKGGLKVITFEKEYSFTFNEQEIKCIAYPGGHSPCDVIIYIPDLKIAYLGDIYLSESFPLIGIGSGARAQILVKNLKKILSTLPEDTRLIPGHGRVTTIDDFKNYRFKSGEEYLNLFENSCDEPIDSSILLNQVEITYATAASYYLNNNYRTQAKKAIQRGLLIVPNSTILNSVNY